MWAWLKNLFKAKPKAVVIPEPVKAPTPKPPNAVLPQMPWVDIAKAELGVAEYRGGENQRILEYHRRTTLKATEDEVPWCSSFVCWVLEQAGYRSTKDAWARSYLGWGLHLDAPKLGAVVIFDRGAGKGHVGFISDFDSENIYVLGGNQDNKVSVKAYPRSKVLGYRWPVK